MSDQPIDTSGLDKDCGNCPFDKGFGHEHDCVWPDCVQQSEIGEDGFPPASVLHGK